MYESFFKLNSKPFDLLPDPRFMYMSKSHKKALTYLDYGIRERSGFILLTGEIGSGKTTLLRDLLDKHYEHVILSKIFNTRVTSDQLLAMINDDFGLDIQGKDKVTLIHDLNEFLIKQYALGNQPILIIDEAQNLTSELLEEVRMLSNLEASNSKLLQIILVGQPELRTILATPKLRQLRQRINISCHLEALERQEVEQYITHRLAVAGNSTAVHFPPEALDVIFRYSRGIPRLINIICDFLLLSAFADETASLSMDLVNEVISDLDFEHYHWLTESVPDEKDNPQEKVFGAVSNIPHSAAELNSMFAHISQRVDYLEHDISASLQLALHEQKGQLESLQSKLASHATKTNISIVQLSRALEKLSATVQNNELEAALEDLGDVFDVNPIAGTGIPRK